MEAINPEGGYNAVRDTMIEWCLKAAKSVADREETLSLALDAMTEIFLENRMWHALGNVADKAEHCEVHRRFLKALREKIVSRRIIARELDLEVNRLIDRYISRGDYETAIPLVPFLNTGQGSAYVSIIKALSKRGDLERAVEVFVKLVTETPSYLQTDFTYQRESILALQNAGLQIEDENEALRYTKNHRVATQLTKLMETFSNTTADA